ncbi:ERD2A [Hepatospora eriocheir]|uniref:ERD2A n=1 Tax=Hepatospora eriocheir TaxID=1081669 RepID=A0A1X0QDP5_9MICR|nr:ERD2A [Hepatospora eriocheir]
MNFSTLFRFVGDGLMIASRAITLKKLRSVRSVDGLSLKTETLYLMVYLSRYLDLFHFYRDNMLDIYNNVFKICFLLYQFYMVIKILVNDRSYNKNKDKFPFSVIIILSLIVTFIINRDVTDHKIKEFFYRFSLILESVALLPQLSMIQECGECETMTGLYIMMLGMYRISYLVYFLLNKFVVKKNISSLLIITSLIQSILHFDFIFNHGKSLLVKKSTIFTNKK